MNRGGAKDAKGKALLGVLRVLAVQILLRYAREQEAEVLKADRKRYLTSARAAWKSTPLWQTMATT